MPHADFSKESETHVIWPVHVIKVDKLINIPYSVYLGVLHWEILTLTYSRKSLSNLNRV